MTVTTDEKRLHVVIMPFLAMGHIIPMVDFGLMLASGGAIVSIVTTPVNAARIQSTVDRAKQHGLQIKIARIPFPWAEAGVPEGLENLDMLHTQPHLLLNFYSAIPKLESQLSQFLRSCPPQSPTCLVSDFLFPWTRAVADDEIIPRYVFMSMPCFTLQCFHTLPDHYKQENIPADSNEKLAIPGIHHRVHISRLQAIGFFLDEATLKVVHSANESADGVVVNTFTEMEPTYVDSYERTVGTKVWTVGPVSLFDGGGKVDRLGSGGESSISVEEVVGWLDRFEPRSVVYACLGSFGFTDGKQTEEMAMGLESSGHPFVLVVGKHEVEEGFEERNTGRGLVIRGWAPQVVILSHPAVGGFVTHCGWNSTIEAITFGVPVMTWPRLGDQFLNERFAVDVVGIGVAVGIERPSMWWEAAEIVGREKVREAVGRLMSDGEDRDGMLKRAAEVKEKARTAIEKGGDNNITGFIEDAMGRAIRMKQNGSIVV